MTTEQGGTGRRLTAAQRDLLGATARGEVWFRVANLRITCDGRAVTTRFYRLVERGLVEPPKTTGPCRLTDAGRAALVEILWGGTP